MIVVPCFPNKGFIYQRLDSFFESNDAFFSRTLIAVLTVYLGAPIKFPAGSGAALHDESIQKMSTGF